MASKKPYDSGKKASLRPAQALRFRIDQSGDLRAAVSASSGEFNLTPEIIELLCLLQKGCQPSQLYHELRARFAELCESLPNTREISALLDDLKNAQCLVKTDTSGGSQGLQDGFGDAWIQWAMLADAPRCKAYQAAIQSTVGANSYVLDVGAGTGLLSLYALEAGAKKVDAIEETSSAEDIKKTRDSLPESLRKRLHIHNCNSFDARLPTQASHVISELFGNDPLQEGVVPTLRNIFARLENEHIVSIPESCTVYVQLVDVVDGPLHTRLSRYADIQTEEKEKWLGAIAKIKSNLKFKDVSFAHAIRPADVQRISVEQKAFSIALAPPPPESAPRPLSLVKIQVARNSPAPAVLVGFRAQLTKAISISNIPGEKDVCEHWSPLILPLSRRLKTKETILLKVSVADDWDRVTVVATDAHGKQLGSRQ